jgi:M6 family metalloprotease-like protein
MSRHTFLKGTRVFPRSRDENLATASGVPALRHQLFGKAVALLVLLVLSVSASSLYSSQPDRSFKQPTQKPILPASAVIFDMPLDQVEELTGVPRAEMALRKLMAPAAPAKAAGTGKVVVLLVDWYDYLADTLANTPGAFDTLYFSTNAISPGSLNDYYIENSFGQFSVDGEVYGWFRLPTYDPNYWFYDGLFTLADVVVDFSQYDQDLDGNVDALWVIHAGPGEEETQNPLHIWSFAVRGYDYETEDGVTIERFSVNPETHADGSRSTIRVPSHEYGHILGLPDLYDYDDKLYVPSYYTPGDANDHPLVNWAIMGYGGYNIMTYIKNPRPHHFSGWSKMQLGWLQPIVLDSSQNNLRVYEIETVAESSLYKIPINESGTEYFLLENRNPNSALANFDKYDSDFSAYFNWFTPGGNPLDSGLLITHVDDNVYPNSSGPSNPHYGVVVVDAGYDPGQPYDGTSEFTEWWYPYEFKIGAAFSGDDAGQTELTSTGVPNSDGYEGPSGIAVTNLSNPGYVMTFDFTRTPVCLGIPGDANADSGLGLPDVISTVNYIFNKPGWPTGNCTSNSNLCWLSDLLCSGDWSGNGTVTLGDVIQGVNYVFSKPNGPWDPVPSETCCLPVP